MLYLHAVMQATSPAGTPQAGMDGGALGFVQAAGLACAVSTAAASDAYTPVRTRILEHQRVVEALMRQTSVLPFRFGMVVEDDDACRRLLVARSGELRAALDRVRDCVEYAIRLSGPSETAGSSPEMPTEGPGTAHLRALIRRAGAWPASTERVLQDSLGTHVAGQMLWPRTPARPELRASLLVRRPQTELFLADLGALQRSRPDLALTCTGPWPPYSFAGDASSGETP